LASSYRSEWLHAGWRIALLVLALASARAYAVEPPLGVTGSDGAAVRLVLRDGEAALIVHFWASWCPECVRELPALERVAARCAGTLSVAAVNVGESLAAAEAFRARLGSGLPLLRDPDGKLWRSLARGLPANLIRTRDGQSVVTGPYSEAEWEARLRELGCPTTKPD
jgi:thiol-disulfide isomerase/thioredoxin